MKELNEILKGFEKGNYLILFHNLSFDGNALIRQLTNKDLLKNPFLLVNKFTPHTKKLKKEMVVHKDADDIISIEIRYKNKENKAVNIIFGCSYKKTTRSVDDLAKMMNLKKHTFSDKYDHETFYNKIIPSIDKNNKDEKYFDVLTYVKNDCYIVKTALNYLNDVLHHINNNHSCILLDRVMNDKIVHIDFLNCFSLPNLVFNMLKNWLWNTGRKHILDNFTINKTHYESFNNNQYKLYTGGFTTFNKKHVGVVNTPGINEKMISIDINSSYPYQMTKPLPITPLYQVKEIKIRDGYDFVIKATIDFDIKKALANSFSFIRKNNVSHLDNFVSNGKDFTVCYWYDEWQYIKKYYDVYNIKEIKYYECKTSNFIADFVNILYDLKLSDEPSLKAIAKLLLNSLYGKFGQKPIFISDIFVKKDDPNYEKILAHYNSKDIMNDRYIVDVKRNETLNDYEIFGFKETTFEIANNYQIASRITSYSRIHLWSLCDIVGWSNVFYMDTDSITFKYSDESILNKIDIHDTKLGAWKVEKQYKEFVYLMVAKKYSGLTIDNQYKQACSGLNKEYININQASYHLALSDRNAIDMEWFRNARSQGKYGLIISRQVVDIYTKHDNLMKLNGNIKV